MNEANDKSREPEHGMPLEQAGHPETMYDRSDLSARAVVYFLITLAITIIGIHLVLWGALRFFAQNQLTPVPRNAAIVTPSWQASPKGDPAQHFPAPQLQPDPVADLNKFRATVEQQMNTSGGGRIAIEQAIDAVAKGTLQVRPQPVLPPRAQFGSGDGSIAGAGGGTEPKGNQ